MRRCFSAPPVTFLWFAVFFEIAERSGAGEGGGVCMCRYGNGCSCMQGSGDPGSDDGIEIGDVRLLAWGAANKYQY